MTEQPDQTEVTSAIHQVVRTLRDGDLTLAYRVDREELHDRHLEIILQQVAWQEGEIKRQKTETIILRGHLRRVVCYGASCLPSNTKQWLEQFTERLESADKFLTRAWLYPKPKPSPEKTT